MLEGPALWMVPASPGGRVGVHNTEGFTAVPSFVCSLSVNCDVLQFAHAWLSGFMDYII